MLSLQQRQVFFGNDRNFPIIQNKPNTRKRCKHTAYHFPKSRQSDGTDPRAWDEEVCRASPRKQTQWKRWQLPLGECQGAKETLWMSKGGRELDPAVLPLVIVIHVQWGIQATPARSNRWFQAVPYMRYWDSLESDIIMIQIFYCSALQTKYQIQFWSLPRLFTTFPRPKPKNDELCF